MPPRAYSFNPDNVTWAEDDGTTLRIRFMGTPEPLLFNRDRGERQYFEACALLRGEPFFVVKSATATAA